MYKTVVNTTLERDYACNKSNLKIQIIVTFAVYDFWWIDLPWILLSIKKRLKFSIIGYYKYQACPKLCSRAKCFYLSIILLSETERKQKK